VLLIVSVFPALLVARELLFYLSLHLTGALLSLFRTLNGFLPASQRLVNPTLILRWGGTWEMPVIIFVETGLFSDFPRIQSVGFSWRPPFLTMISSPSCVHNDFSFLWGVGFSFKNSVTCLGTIVVPPLLRIVIPRSSYVKSACGRSKSAVQSVELVWRQLRM
jgi:hypothetical protein